MINDDNIGKVFRDALKDYGQEPSQGVWTSIQGKVSGVKPPAKINPLVKNLLISFTAVVVTAVITLVAYNHFTGKPQNVAENQTAPKETVTAEQPVNNAVTSTENQGKTNFSPNKPNQPGNIISITSLISGDTLTAQNQNLVFTTRKDGRDSSIQNPGIVYAEKPVQNPKTNENTSGSYTNNKNAEEVEAESISYPVRSSDITYDQEKTICKGSSVTLHASGGVSYHWINGEVTDSITVSPAINTAYYVIIKDRNGDEHKGLISVNVTDCNTYIVPKAFTPNGDGVLDVFFAYVKDVTEFQMVIYSRSGEKVFESKNPDMGWDGTFKGERAPIGAYIYIIKFIDAFGKPHEDKGSVTLVR